MNGNKNVLKSTDSDTIDITVYSYSTTIFESSKQTLTAESYTHFSFDAR